MHAKLSTARFSAAHTPRPPTTEGAGKASALATSAPSEDDGAISRATSEAISEDGGMRRPTFKDAGQLCTITRRDGLYEAEEESD